MNILLNKEIIHSVRQQLEISENNIGKARRLYEEGVLTEDKLQSIMLQKDNELYSLAEAEGSLRSSILSLCSLLNIRNYDSFDVKEDTSFVFNDSIPYADVITVVHSLPQIKSAKGKVNSAEYSLKIAQGDLYPTISLGTATASSFSGARQRPLLDKSGNPVVGESGIVFRNYPFINQLSDNRNSYIALTFNMPLFGIFQTNKNISLARNNIRLAQYEMENTEKNMTEQLFQVYTEVDMARKKYKAALSSVERGKIILVHARNKLSNGTLTVSDYMIEKENMLIAEAQASKAKYEYFFKICLLKFYCAIK
jgi:outer membrane protein